LPRSGAQLAIDGGAGIDLMRGWGGDDVYYVDSKFDRAIEATSSGSDTVYARSDYALARTSEIEFLRADAGSLGLRLIGNAIGNGIDGGDGNDTLDGREGSDVMRGGGGQDRL
jgi:Ca2+-binding RTX toxin-like protein